MCHLLLFFFISLHTNVMWGEQAIQLILLLPMVTQTTFENIFPFLLWYNTCPFRVTCWWKSETTDSLLNSHHFSWKEKKAIIWQQFIWIQYNLTRYLCSWNILTGYLTLYSTQLHWARVCLAYYGEAALLATWFAFALLGSVDLQQSGCFAQSTAIRDETRRVEPSRVYMQ